MSRKHGWVTHIVGFHLARTEVEYIFGPFRRPNNRGPSDAAYFPADITPSGPSTSCPLATMAEGYVASGRRMGVVAATYGGGELNLVPALVNRAPAAAFRFGLVGQKPPGDHDGGGQLNRTPAEPNGSLNAGSVRASIGVLKAGNQRRGHRPALPASIAAAQTGCRTVSCAQRQFRVIHH